MLNAYDEEAPPEEAPVEEDQQNHKADIIVSASQALSSWRTTSFNSLRSISRRIISASGREPQTCAICLERYKEGDEICWSKNENCAHAFHLDCMVEWLMANDDCPLCRENYLEESVTLDYPIR